MNKPIKKTKKIYVSQSNKNKNTRKTIIKRNHIQCGGNQYNIDCIIGSFNYGNVTNQPYDNKGIRNVRDCEYVEDKIIKHLYGKNFVGIPIIETLINDIRTEKYKDEPNGTKYPYEKLTRYERLKHLVFQSIENNPDIPEDIKKRVTKRYYSGFFGLFRRILRSNKESYLHGKNKNDNNRYEESDENNDKESKKVEEKKVEEKKVEEKKSEEKKVEEKKVEEKKVEEKKVEEKKVEEKKVEESKK